MTGIVCQDNLPCNAQLINDSCHFYLKEALIVNFYSESSQVLHEMQILHYENAVISSRYDVDIVNLPNRQLDVNKYKLLQLCSLCLHVHLVGLYTYIIQPRA